jgi:hypothetical protein
MSSARKYDKKNVTAGHTRTRNGGKCTTGNLVLCPSIHNGPNFKSMKHGQDMKSLWKKQETDLKENSHHVTSRAYEANSALESRGP